ncbi:MAG: hypothetical protein D6744_02065 [Planctomycetota bacterium]|nr:MAG: hypothetical protein D6744_02065 [Planctomycetota bacterium]
MNEAVIIRGVSGAAQYVAQSTQRDRRHLHKSFAFGIGSMLRDELAEAWAECQKAGWDGYGALPVSRDALRNTYVFLEAWPLGFPLPSIGAEPDGHLTLEWYRNPRRVLSVSVSPDDLLHYAALLGASRTCGTEAFFGEIPDTILGLVRRVYS